MLDTEPVRMALEVKALRTQTTLVMATKVTNTSRVVIVNQAIASQVLTVSLAAIVRVAMIPDMITTRPATALDRAIRLTPATKLPHTVSLPISNRVMSLHHGGLTIQTSLETKMQLHLDEMSIWHLERLPNVKMLPKLDNP